MGELTGTALVDLETGVSLKIDEYIDGDATLEEMAALAPLYTEELNARVEFFKKNEFLGDRYDEIEPRAFYRYVFPEGVLERLGHQDDHKPNGLILEIVKRPGRTDTGLHTILTDGLEQLEDALTKRCVICSPISYYGRSRKASNAICMHALTLDIDYVGLDKLEHLCHWIENEFIPRPTFLVNSGHGVHLYYVFDELVPMFKQNQKEIRKLKQQLVRQIWTDYTSDNVDALETLGVVQGFRMVGSNSKLDGYTVTAFQTGERVSLDYLNGFVMPNHQAHVIAKSKLTLKEAKEAYPEWYQRVVVEGRKPGRWHVKRDLYDWYKGRIESEATYGHRYFCMMCLAVFARKCDIPYDELERDALSFQPKFNSLKADHPFTVEETFMALEAYNEDYVTFPRDSIARLTAMDMPANKRNGRKQEIHLKIARSAQAIMDEVNGTNWREGNGRPRGSKNKKNEKREKILAYAEANPEASHSEIARELGISRPTVIKWLRAQECADFDAELPLIFED